MAVISDVTVRLRMDMRELNGSLETMGKQMETSTLGAQVALNQLSSTFTKLGKQIVGLGTESYNTFAEFERGMSRVSAMADLTKDEFDSISDKAKELGRNTEYTAVEVTDAFQAMALAGFDYTEMMEAVAPALDLATISGLEFGDVTSYMINAIKPFGKEATDAKDIVDLFAKTATSANFNINDLAKSFEYVAPIAGSMGYEMKDVNVALALLAENGLKGSKAGTSLRRMLTDLNSKAEEGVIQIGDYAVAISDAETGAMRPLLDVLKDMSGAFDGLTESEKAQYAETLVGKTGMAGFLAIMEQGEVGIQEMTDKVYDYNGASEKMTEIIRGDAQGSLDNLKSAFEGVKIRIGEALDVAVRPFIDGLTELARWFAELPEPIMNAILIFGGLIAVIGIVLGVVTGAMALWTAFTAVIGTAFAPVIIVIGVIVGLVGAVLILWNTSEQFREAVQVIWWAISDLIRTVCDGIAKFWDNWGATILGTVKSIWKLIEDFISNAMNVISAIIRVITSIIQGDWKAFWDNILKLGSSIFQMAVDLIVGIFNGLLDFVGRSISKMLNSFVDGFDKIKYAITHPIETAVNIFKGAIDKMKNFLNFNWEFPKLKMPHFSISGSMNPLKWFDEGVPKIAVDWYAKGGIFSGAQVIGVGESGDEAVVPLNNRTKVKPFAQAVATEMGGSGTGGGDVNINVSELVVREEADVRRIAQELHRLQQFKSRGKGR